MSFPRYPSYKNSGVEWLGDVPVHWATKRIKDTTYLKGRVGWKGLNSDEYLESGYAYLVTGTDFGSKYISWNECHFVDRERYEDDPFIQLKNGDLLITKDGTIGKLALVSNLDTPACLNSGIFLLRPQRSYTTDFMYWVLSSNAFQVFCDLASQGSTIQHLYQNVFDCFVFPVPSLEEQAVITAFLDRETAKIDALVAEQQRLMELLKEKRQAVISHAVTKGLSPKVAVKESGVKWFGHIPEHWTMARLRHACSSIFLGLTSKVDYVEEGGVPLVRALNISGGVLDLSDARCISNEQHKNLTKRNLARRGDVLLSKSGSIGTAAIVDCDTEFSIYESIFALRALEGVLTPEYLLYLLRSDLCAAQYSASLVGMGVGHLNMSDIVDVRVALPSLREQLEIVAFLEAEVRNFDTLAVEAQHAIGLLHERRTALITAAITGQMDLRGMVRAAAV